MKISNLLVILSRAKDGGSYANICGSEVDGVFKVARHAHAQLQRLYRHAQRLGRRSAALDQFLEEVGGVRGGEQL